MVDSQNDWESTCRVRRDTAPHRGLTLVALALISVFASLISFAAVPAILALTLGIVVYYTARNDMRKMEQGMLDPYGLSLTSTAQHLAIAGIVVALLLGTVPCLLLAWLAILQLTQL